MCRYVPDEANGGPPGAKSGYWKTMAPGEDWSRYDLNGNPISPEEAHPSPGPPGIPSWTIWGIAAFFATYSAPAY